MSPAATECRAYPLAAGGMQFRGEVEGRHMVGLVAPYNTPADVGPFTETLRPGVFAKSIRESARSLPLHVMHRHDEVPVARAVGWEDGDTGLVGDFLFDTRAEAREAARLAEEGFLPALSVGFVAIEPHGSRWDMGGVKPHVERVEARMVETSLVSVPVYAGAGVIAVRSLGVPGDERTVVAPRPRLLEALAWRERLRR